MGPEDIVMAGRLSLAAVLGGLVGLEREMHHQPAGLRTHMIVAIGSCLVMLTSLHMGDMSPTKSDPARLAAQVVAGVGFLGAGVIVRGGTGHRVHGLTTAACVWVTACLGAACAIAEWQIVVLGIALVFVILIFGGPFEKAIEQRWPVPKSTDVGDKPPDRARMPGTD